MMIKHNDNLSIKQRLKRRFNNSAEVVNRRMDHKQKHRRKKHDNRDGPKLSNERNAFLTLTANFLDTPSKQQVLIGIEGDAKSRNLLTPSKLRSMESRSNKSSSPNFKAKHLQGLLRNAFEAIALKSTEGRVLKKAPRISK